MNIGRGDAENATRELLSDQQISNFFSEPVFWRDVVRVRVAMWPCRCSTAGRLDRLDKAFDANVFETEAALNTYLAEHRDAPFRTLREILLSGRMVPSRALTMMSVVGKSTDDIGYLQVLRVQEETRQLVLALMADQKLDALMYATFDHQPGVMANDVMSRPVVDDFAGIGNNRRLSRFSAFLRWRYRRDSRRTESLSGSNSWRGHSPSRLC